MALTDNNTTTVMPVSPMGFGNGNGGGNGGMWGGDWSAWIVLFLIFGMFGGGWGNGWGGNGGMNGLSALGALPGYTQTNDFSNLERKMDIIQGEACNNYGNLSAALSTGLQGIQTQFATAELSRANTAQQLTGQMYNMQMQSMQQASDNAMAVMGGFNGVQAGQAAMNYNLAQQGCDTRNTINSTTRDIIDSQTAGTRAILDALNAQALEAKNDRIAELENQNNALRLAASQQAQNAYLVDQLRPSPIPAYQVANPYAGGYGCNCAGNYA